jgi:hypothetical protein
MCSHHSRHANRKTTLTGAESKLPIYWQALVIPANINDVACSILIRKGHLKCRLTFNHPQLKGKAFSHETKVSISNCLYWDGDDRVWWLILCQLNWAKKCPGIWSNIILSMSMRMFLDEINVWITRLGKAGCSDNVGEPHSINWRTELNKKVE